MGALQKAINKGDMAYFYTPSNNRDLIIGSTKTTPRDRVNAVLTQISVNQNILETMGQEFQSGNFATNRFVNGLFNDLSLIYNDIKQGPDGQLLATYSMQMTFHEFVNDFYGSAFAIPGMEDKVKLADEGRRQNRISTAIQDAETADIVADVSTITLPAPNTENGTSNAELLGVQRYPRKYQLVVDTVLKPYLARSITAPEISGRPVPMDQAVNMALDRFIIYKKNEKGERRRDANNNLIPEEDQPILEFFERLRTTGIAGTNLTEFDSLTSILDPRRSKVDLLDDTQKDIAVKFTDAVNGDLRLAVSTLAPLISSSAGTRQAMVSRFGWSMSPKKEQDFINNQRDVSASASRGIDIVKRAMDTYFVVDPATGSLIELDSTAVADISLFAEGAKYLAGTAADFFNIDFTNSAAVESAGREYILQARNQLRQNGVLVESSEAIADMEDVLKDVANSKYAQREFFTLVLAYEVAATIQGGTGGRTISDQDVALIFRGLRQRWSDDPKAQRQALMAVRGMLERFKFRADLMTDPNDLKSRAAYLTAENLLTMGGEDVVSPYTRAYVVNEFSDAPEGDTGADNFFGLGRSGFENEVLRDINDNREGVGEPPFATFEEAKEAMGSPYINRIIPTTRSRLGASNTGS